MGAPSSSLNNKDVKFEFHVDSMQYDLLESVQNLSKRRYLAQKESSEKIITIETLKPTTDSEIWPTDLENVMKMDGN